MLDVIIQRIYLRCRLQYQFWMKPHSDGFCFRFNGWKRIIITTYCRGFPERTTTLVVPCVYTYFLVNCVTCFAGFFVYHEVLINVSFDYKLTIFRFPALAGIFVINFDEILATLVTFSYNVGYVMSIWK